MSNADDVLGGIYDNEAIQERKAAGMAAYEEKIVKKILQEAQLGDRIVELAARVKEKTGKGRLTFDWFFEEYPSFPLWLGMRKLPFAFQTTIKDLFNKFTSTPMFKAWEEFVDECPLAINEKPVGVIFDWPGVHGTQMIIHNDHRIDVAVPHFLKVVGMKSKAQMIVIQQFAPFLKRTLSRWIP